LRRLPSVAHRIGFDASDIELETGGGLADREVQSRTAFALERDEGIQLITQFGRRVE
jgi:hypothetical protein